MRPLARTTALAALASLLASCGGDAGGPDASVQPGPDASGIAAPDASLPPPADAATPDAGTVAPADAGPLPSPDAGADPGQMARCYSQATFGPAAFATDPAYLVDQDGYEYTANHAIDPTYAQMLSVALWPLSASTALTGTFDLAQEPFSYAKCERCVLVIAGKSATDQKHYLAQEGTLAVTEVTDTRIAGSLAGVKLAEVKIDETTLATSLVAGGCTLSIPALSFSYVEPVVDPRIAQCYLPETFTADQFSDYVYPYEVNDTGWFYRALELPSSSAIPSLTLFVEVYEDGVGTFPLAGAEVNCPTCMHFVIIEAQTSKGDVKTFVSSGGNLVLTTLSATAMVGSLDNVTLVETTVSGSTFTPVAGGCTTTIPSLAFDSANATP